MYRVKIYIFVFSYENQGAEEGGLTLGGVGLGASPGRPPITSSIRGVIKNQTFIK